jgi:hypothetical protein
MLILATSKQPQEEKKETTPGLFSYKDMISNSGRTSAPT